MRKILFVSRYAAPVTEPLAEKYDIRYLAPCDALDGPVSSHADMLVGVLDGRLLVTRSYYDRNRELFCGADVVITNEEYGKEYPHDVLLNFIDAGDVAVGSKKAVSAAVVKPVINVKQGYTRCSTLIFGKNAVSADAGILSALSGLGYDTLEISAGGILLEGYDHGFIGGASFSDCSTVCFFGSLSYHPDGERIRAFIDGHGFETAELSDTPLYDHGGAVITDQKK